ncbi:MAG: hypothetical protein HKN10_17665 [Myxococcales bacterium]|nr:hypothetical protein [Myxococcales bacterium]
MTRTTTKTASLTILAMLACACGDPGDAQFNDNPGFESPPAGFEDSSRGDEPDFESPADGEGVAIGENPFEEGPARPDIPVIEPIFDPAPPALVELTDEELLPPGDRGERDPAFLAEDDERLAAIVHELVNSDVVVEVVGTTVVVTDTVTAAELDRLVGAGFDVAFVDGPESENTPADQTAPASISIDFTRLAAAAADSHSHGCERHLLLEIRDGIIAAVTECDFIDVVVDVIVFGDRSVRGRIRLDAGGSPVLIDVQGELDGNALEIRFSTEVRFPPFNPDGLEFSGLASFTDVWEGTLRADLF